MDTAFINRVGVTRGWQYQGLSFYPDEKRYPWLKRVNPFLWVMSADDRVQGGSELWVIPAIRFNFTRQGYLRLDVMRGHETFAQQRFEVGRVFADGGAQITRWLSFGGNINNGPAVSYDVVDPFQGTRRSLSARVGLQPNSKLNNNVSYTFVHFERRETQETVYDVHIVNLRNTYQFTPQFFIRAITQSTAHAGGCWVISLRRTSSSPAPSCTQATAHCGSSLTWIPIDRPRARSSSRRRIKRGSESRRAPSSAQP